MNTEFLQAEKQTSRQSKSISYKVQRIRNDQKKTSKPGYMSKQ